MVFHELAINAVKHGSLSAAEGSIDVVWSIAADRLELDWVEKKGPVVVPPTRTGFGAHLLARALKHYGGGVTLDHRPAGLHCRVSLPLPDCRIPHVPEIPRRFSDRPA
jgi:two-component sensor histidine kinase